MVDDEPGIRLLLSRLLSRLGYLVDVAEDGYDAWGSLHKNRYGALIVDLRMPGSSGRELYVHVQAFDPSLAQRTLFITGDVVGHQSREFVASTGNPVLEKPFDLAELQRNLESLFDSRGREKAAPPEHHTHLPSG
ncbi:MAG: response regulator [Chloroflexi bacterium]|nr:response regulator [Chloroflexota bacterium]